MSACLASFCLKAYNQKAYILEALAGALAQTYRPLEIVICDDHSTDGTWEAISERFEKCERVAETEARRFSTDDGIEVVLHRNAVNLGNAKNWEMCGKLAHGELLIKADGDDISLPERTERIMSAWIADGKRAKVVTHAVTTIPGDRVIDGHGAGNPLGAAMAWSRDCFAGWPEIGEDCRRSFDDVVYSYRARLLGPELVLHDRLVRYRLGSGETSNDGDCRKPFTRGIGGALAATPQKQRDLTWALHKGMISDVRYAEEQQGIAVSDRYFSDCLIVLSGASVWRKLPAFLRIRKAFNWRGKTLYGICLLPDPLIGPTMRLAGKLRDLSYFLKKR